MLILGPMGNGVQQLRVALVAIALVFSTAVRAAATAEAGDQTRALRAAPQAFNEGWRFSLGENAGAEMADFDDHAWRSVDLPHDWSIEDPAGVASENGAHVQSTPEGNSVGYLPGGIGWYRKHFVLSAEDAAQGVALEFDGAQQDADLWVNGTQVLFQPHGYIAFHAEIAPYLKPAGQDNVIVVRAVNPNANTRWYAGSGLYREVTLRVHDRLHVPVWGARIDTAWLTAAKALVQLKLDIQNDRSAPEDVSVELALTAPDGQKTVHPLGQLRVAAGQRESVGQQLELNAPQLWSVEQPQLYTAEFRLSQRGQVVDVYTQTFGVRTVAVSAEKGLLLNGRPVKLKGGCLHHDNGLLGAAAFPTAEYRRVALMKQNGFNAIRTSHNPPSSAFLDACDRLGMLVIDEFADQWELPKKVNGYQRYFGKHWERDLGAMIARDFNHPSVIIWSIGNEISERATATGVTIGRRLATYVRSQDSRRPVTNALCGFWDNPQLEENWDATAAAFALLDIGGYNYLWGKYESDHAKHPARVMAGTESFPKDALANWRAVEQHSYVIGDFVWTGMDHLGESGIGHSVYVPEGTDPAKATPSAWGLMPWPWYINWSGDIDLIGHKKPQSYYRDVVWGERPIELAVHEPIPAGQTEIVGTWGWPAEVRSWNWTGQEGKSLKVNVYSRADHVRLELNGRVLGEQAIDAAKSITATFTVPYEAGTLKATALAQGRAIGSCALATSGAPVSIKLTPETKDAAAARGSLIYVPIEIVDQSGNVVPDAQSALTVAVSGPVELVALGSASPTDIGSLKDDHATTFRGNALAIVRPTGKPGTATVKVTGVNLREAVAAFELAAPK